MSYQLVDFKDFEHLSSEKKTAMFFRIINASPKLKDHAGACGWKEDCKFCPKMAFLSYMLADMEQKMNITLDIKKLLVEEIVEEMIFKDDLFKLIK